MSCFSSLGLACLTLDSFLNYYVLITYPIVVTKYLQIVAYVRKEGFIYIIDTKFTANRGKEGAAAGARGGCSQYVHSQELER